MRISDARSVTTTSHSDAGPSCARMCPYWPAKKYTKQSEGLFGEMTTEIERAHI